MVLSLEKVFNPFVRLINKGLGNRWLLVYFNFILYPDYTGEEKRMHFLYMSLKTLKGKRLLRKDRNNM